MVTIDIILYHLGKNWPSTVFRNPYAASFQNVTMYHPGVERLGPEVLYVLPSDAPFPEIPASDKLCFLAASEPDALPSDQPCIVVPDGDPVEILQDLMLFFLSFERWRSDLLVTGEKFESVQRLLDISADWIPYATCIWDATFSLVAFSKHVSSENPMFQAIISKGYLPSSLVKQLFRMDLLSNPAKFSTTTVHQPPNVAGEYEICQSFRVSTTTTATFCMFVGQQEPHPGLVEIVALLCRSIQKYYDHMGRSSNGTYRSIDYLLCRLLDDFDSMVEGKQPWLESLSLPLNAQYSLYKVSLAQPTSGKLSLALSQLRRNMPYSEVFFYDGAICTLNRRARHFLDEESHQAYVDSVRDFLVLHDAYCGVSSTFEPLNKISLAHTQATAALNIGRNLRPNDRILYYDDCYTYHLLALAGENADLMDLCAPPLRALIESDRSSHMDNTSLLRAYLRSDRNITQTAKLMHLHRNSVIYRVGRIQEIIAPMVLDDPDTRLHLLNSFKILDYLESMGKQ